MEDYSAWFVFEPLTPPESPPPELAEQWWPTTWYPNPEDDPDRLYQLALEYAYFMEYPNDQLF